MENSTVFMTDFMGPGFVIKEKIAIFADLTNTK